MSVPEVDEAAAAKELSDVEKKTFKVLKGAMLKYFDMPSNTNGKVVMVRMQAYQDAWMAGRVRMYDEEVG